MIKLTDSLLQQIINKCNSALYTFFSIELYSEEALPLRNRKTLDFRDCCIAAIFYLKMASAVQRRSSIRLSSPLDLEVIMFIKIPKIGNRFLDKRFHLKEHDRFAVAGKVLLPNKLARVVVGHIPREISRHTWHAILNGALITGKVENAKPKASPLVQGGLEIIMRLKV